LPRLIQKMSSIATRTKEPRIVFLLDDDPSVLKATRRLLASAGWEAEAFNDPHSFLEQVAKQCPPVAVIDILMPQMNGLEVQKRLRSVSPSTQVIILTSRDDPSVRSTAMEAGASAFFLKQVEDDVLLAGIASAIAAQ
jgi:FixJ family two-component response regulator